MRGEHEGWIDNRQAVVLVQERLLVVDACLQVMDALHIRDVGAKAGIGQRSILADGLRLEIGSIIGEGICARIVVVLIPPHVGAQGKQSCVTEQVVPRRGDIEGLDLRALVRGADRQAVGAEAAV